MNYKKAGRATGIAFIIGTAAGIACLSFVNGVSQEGYLMSIAEQPNKLALGALLIIIMGMACASIAYAIYPVLSKYNKGLAIASVGFRTMEGVMHLLTAIVLLTLIPLAAEFANTNSEMTLVVGNTLVELQEILSIGIGIAFITGALFYNIGFFKTKLVPRWLAIWGIIALIMHLAERGLMIFGAIDTFSTVSVVLNVPIAIQEMVMAVYLIIFGFRKIPVTE